MKLGNRKWSSVVRLLTIRLRYGITRAEFIKLARKVRRKWPDRLGDIKEIERLAGQSL